MKPVPQNPLRSTVDGPVAKSNGCYVYGSDFDRQFRSTPSVRSTVVGNNVLR